MNDKQRKAMFANINFKGNDKRIHQLKRLDKSDVIPDNLKVIVNMRPPRSKKDYEQTGYTIKGSRLMYHRSRSGYVVNRENELARKKLTWSLLFDKENPPKLLKVDGGARIFIDRLINRPTRYYFVHQYPKSKMYHGGSLYLNQSDFDKMGINPLQFTIPDNAELDYSLGRKKIRAEEDRHKMIKDE